MSGEVELRIDRLCKTGEGIATYQGQTLFVDGALPGEQVLARLGDESRPRRARVIRMLQPSPLRQTPSCSLSERCGGCDWLHFGADGQRQAKLEIALSTLEHIGGIERRRLDLRPIASATHQMGYRRRAVLHLERGRLCFYERRTHHLVPIQSCPALVESLLALPDRLAPSLAPLGADLKEVHLLAEGDEVAFAAFLKGPLRPAHRTRCERAISALGLRGAVIVPRPGAPLLLGDPVLGAQCPLRPQITLYRRPDLFSQASAEGDATLARAVLECLAPGPTDRILELFGGNGNLTFPIASDASGVTCVERSNAALELARRSAREGGVENVRFLQGDAARICRGLVQEGVRFDKLLVDPPRGGTKGVASWAEALGAKELVYVGCDAAALARDALALGKVGFTPRALHLIDMFPQTHHAELVMSFEREAAPGPGLARPSLPAGGG